MVKGLAASVLVLGLMTSAVGAQQAAPVTGTQEVGARAGNSYIPSTHTPGCGGLMCDGNDAAVAAGPPPPCQGLICGMTPYAMQPPMTASQAAQAGAAQAAAPAPVVAEEKPAKSRKRRAARKATKTVAARTPDPAPAAPAATPAR